MTHGPNHTQEAAPSNNHDKAPSDMTDAQETSGDAQQLSLFSNEQIEHYSTQTKDGWFHPGQWRLEHVQVVNWGTFGGLHNLDVARKGLLITGPSGSGKSSLLDAITTVLTPPRSVRFNAAAITGRTSGEDRSLASYIRGAWRHETGTTGEITSSYLRKGATWSGILLRFSNGVREAALAQGENSSPALRARANEPVTLIALYHLKSGSTTTGDVTKKFVLARGTCSLKDFEPFIGSSIDSAGIKKNITGVEEVFNDHSKFSARFRRLLGISSERTLELLHKTQAAKNFDSLDNLFRRFMLDEPETFAQAREATEQFQELSQAYNEVADQRRQRDCLKPLEELKAKVDASDLEIEKMRRLSDDLDTFAQQAAIEVLREQKQRFQAELDHALDRENAAKFELQEANARVDQAQARLTDVGGDRIAEAQLHASEYELALKQVLSNRKHLLRDLSCAGIEQIPETPTEFAELSRTIIETSQKAQADLAAKETETYSVFARVTELQKRADSVKEELIHLRRRATNMPSNLDTLRAEIATHLGLSRDELPFVGELINVDPQFASWQGAIERLLGNQAKTLLVPAKRAAQVARYVDGRHLNMRFEFEAVEPEVEVPQRTLPEESLVRRVTVVSHKSHAEFSRWVNRLLREQFNFICVESASELVKHEFALTRAGQIKRRDRYVKDDRYRVDDRRRWVLGNNNDDKIEQFEQLERELNLEIDKASHEAQEVQAQYNRAHSLLRAAELLADARWESYDVQAARVNLENARDFLAAISNNNAEAKEATAALEEARSNKTHAEQAYVDCRAETAGVKSKLEEVTSAIDKRAKALGSKSAVASNIAAELSGMFAKASKKWRQSVENVFETSGKVQKSIETQHRHHAAERANACSKATRIMQDYYAQWQTQAKDLTTEYDDVNAYLGILRRIEISGLPDYESEFLRVLHNFSQDRISVIAHTIRTAFREVKSKLEPVNRSLALSEYDEGIHLRIEARSIRPREANEFLDRLNEIATGTWDDEDIASAEARYMSVAEIINRLNSSEAADRRWTRLCLDTREHVGFAAKEIDDAGVVQNIHSSDAGLSGGQKQKLVVFCLAAALRYQLADEDQPTPTFGTVVLDEAFDKADNRFTMTAMNIFEVFGFHMVLATPLKLLTTLEPHVGAIVAVNCKDSKYSSLSAVPFQEEPENAE